MKRSSPKEKFKQRVLQTYFVRFHMSMILGATIAAGVLTSRTLLHQGFDSVMLRYPVGVLMAYLAFLLLIRIWIWYVRTERSAELDLLEGVDTGDPLPSGGGFTLPSVDLDIDGEGCLILVLFLALVFVIVMAGGYLIWAAPEILTEAAFEAILASSLVKIANRMEREGWVVNVVKSTIIPFVVVLGMTVALAYVIQKTCPSARTLREGVNCPERRKVTKDGN